MILKSFDELVESIKIRGLESKLKPLICVVGPTATFKTKLSIKLAKKLDSEIINADSRQFYKGMDIGTAKVSEDEMDGVVHHALDFLNPDEDFNISHFQKIVYDFINNIHNKNKIPMMVGGSGLFVDSVRNAFIIPKVRPNLELRSKINQMTNIEIFEKLKKIDKNSAEEININNRKRLERALEVCLSTGNKFSDLKLKEKKKYNDIVVSTFLDPKINRENIKKRTEMIWQNGFLKEVEKLLKNGYDEKLNSMNAHGYREAIFYLKGRLQKKDAIDIMNKNTIAYAKRQRTWWRRYNDIIYFDSLCI